MKTSHSSADENTAAELVRCLTEAGLTLSVAESCTGGMIAAEIVSVPGASAVFAGGAVTYMTRVKEELLEVPPALIEKHTVVSAEVACSMASGVARRLHTDVAMSVTGVAGPGGGTSKTPVGCVYIGVYREGRVEARRFDFAGDREAVRRQAAEAAMEMALQSLKAERE